jgi:MFS family permease
MNLRQLIPLYLGAATGPMGGIGIVTLLPVLAKALSVEFGTISLTIPFYMVPFIIVQMFSGSIAQLFDVRKTLLFGFGVYCLGALLCGLSLNMWMLLGSRVIQGIGAAFLTPIIMAMIGELVPERHVGKAIGVLGLAYTVGVTLGPLISGLTEVRYGWPGFFYFLAILSAVPGFFYWISSREIKRIEGQKESIPAILPVLKNALIQPGVLFMGFSAFCLFIGYIGIMTFTADHLKAQFNLPSDQIGTMLSFTGFSGIIAAPISGFLGDRLGRGTVFILGTVIAFSSLLLMATIDYSYSTYLIFFLILGAGTATAWTNLNTMAVEISPTLRKPVTSVYNAIKFTGYAISPVVLLALYAPFHLLGVQIGCMCAVCISSILALMAVGRSKGTP